MVGIEACELSAECRTTQKRRVKHPRPRHVQPVHCPPQHHVRQLETRQAAPDQPEITCRPQGGSHARPKLRRIEQVLRGYGNNIAQARLLAHGVSPAVLSPVPVQEYDTATGASRSGKIIGAIFGIFFLVPVTLRRR